MRRTRLSRLGRHQARNPHFVVRGAARPASTTVIVAGLVDPRWKVEIEAEAIVP
jgi:enamine deaminase RidA (YjgF/YER057c/UK114 family)